MDIYGLLGYPTGHSLSPKLHNIVYRHFKIDAAYTLFEVPNILLKDAVYGIKALNIKGANVTIPYKEEIIKYIEDLSGEALKIGAVNTLKFENGILKGYNTDYFGFKESLIQNGVSVNDKHVFVLGTGGASRAVVQCLLDEKAYVHVFGRNSSNADKLLNLFKNGNSRIFTYNMNNVSEEVSHIKPYMMVNCTPVGMKGYVGSFPFRFDCINGNVEILYDLVYNPQKTEFLLAGEKFGCNILSGMDMLIMQAFESIKIWTGLSIDLNYGKTLLAKEGFIKNV